MCPAGALHCRRADGPRCAVIERGKLLRHALSAFGQQYLSPGFKEILNARPRVADYTGARTGRLENPGGRRGAVSRHAFTIDVKHCLRRAIERIVVACVDMAGIHDVGRHRLIGPAIPAKKEAALRQTFCGFQKKFLHAGFAVGQAVSKCKIAAKRGSGATG